MVKHIKINKMDRQDLILKTVPIATDSYAPVPNKELLNVIDEELYKRGLYVKSERFITDRGGNKVIGYFDIEHPDSNEIGMRLAFRNSYDKSMSAAFVAGNNVWICSNGCISGELQFVRRHTGTVLTELKAVVVKSADMLEDRFAKFVFQSERMKSIEINKLEASQLYGRLFMYDKLLTVTQMAQIQRELEKPTFEVFQADNLWSIYNHGTYALKDAHPNSYIDSHIKYHSKFEELYAINQ